MFTGIVQALGTVCGTESRDGDLVIEIEAQSLGDVVIEIGDSVAVNGVCLTAVRQLGQKLLFDVSRETLSCTRLGKLAPGSQVNLELAMRAQDRFGGHLVSGHVDGLAILIAREASARSTQMSFRAPAEVAPFIAEKGSVTIDGVSLTLNRVIDVDAGVEFELNLVPHTLTVTTLGALQVGQAVHLEVDMVARYLKRLQDYNQ